MSLYNLDRFRFERKRKRSEQEAASPPAARVAAAAATSAASAGGGEEDEGSEESSRPDTPASDAAEVTGESGVRYENRASPSSLEIK